MLKLQRKLNDKSFRQNVLSLSESLKYTIVKISCNALRVEAILLQYFNWHKCALVVPGKTF